MTSLNVQQMDDSCKVKYNVLCVTMEKISATLGENESTKMKSIDDLRELSGRIKVFMAGKLKQLTELIERLKLILTGKEPQSEPPLFINDVQGFYDLTMIEARNIEQRIKELMPSSNSVNISKHARKSSRL